MRRLPDLPWQEIDVKRREKVTLSAKVHLTTRLYGGGARPGEIDERSWIRPPAFKSALRFWWRAGHAHLFASLAEMHQRESELFGSAARYRGKEIEGGQGLVSVRVEASPSHQILTAFFPSTQGDALNLAYFPAALAQDERPAARLGIPDPKKVHATLFIDLPAKTADEDCAEVLTALRLFLVLGGAGARARRGAGALGLFTEENARSLGVPTTRPELVEFLKQHAAPKPHAGPAGVFSLAGCTALWLGAKSDGSAEKTQTLLLEMLREARQDRPHPRNWQGSAGWGRSRWPEADAIRFKTRRSNPSRPDWRHQPRAENQGLFPRAALGLPIILHFKDHLPGQDPPDQTISAFRPGRKEGRISRFASPLLLRPVQIWEKGQPAFLPLALLGPMTLPPQAIPLVEPTKGGKPSGKPTAEPSLADTFPDFPIASSSDKAFAKLIEKFSALQKLL